MAKLQHGTIIKRSGSWVGRYSRWVFDNKGVKKRMQKSFVIAPIERMTKVEARRILHNRIEVELGLRSNARMSLKRFIGNRWLPMRESSWRKSTKAVNLWMLSLITDKFGTMALEHIDAVTLQRWLDEIARTKSASLVRHIRILLKSIFAEVVDEDFLRKSPARSLRIPSALKPVAKNFLTIEQIQKLLQTAKGQDRIILSLFLTIGLRPSELFALKWRSFDPQKGLLHIVESIYRGDERDFTKTTNAGSRKELQVVFLPQELVLDLQAWRKLSAWDKDEDYIFCNDMNGNFLWKENFYHRVLVPLQCRAFHDGSCAEKGIKCQSKDVPKLNYQVFRRSCATHCQGLGSAKDVQTMLRHSRPLMAQLEYVQPLENSVRSTVEKLAAVLLPPLPQ